MIYAATVLFVFFIIMVLLIICLERYGKHCEKNNDEVIWYTEWLQSVGMHDTRKMVDRRWKHKW